MARIYLCFVWHMHQPFYKDLITGEYRLPWTRMHGLKDYYGMVKILEHFPAVHQTFNLVPSLLVQLEEYAAGQAADPFLGRALKPAEALTEEEYGFILQYFFQANPSRLIYRYPRYGELYDAWNAAGCNTSRARRFFGAGAMRDLQVLSQLAWFDEEFLEKDPEVRALADQGRDYTLADQALMGRKQREILAAVLPVYKEFAARGQIELSTSPFYHPILPLLCDSNIAAQAHPNVPLPTRFCRPEDARAQVQRAREYMASRFGLTPAGLWPSEGSVSDEALGIAADLGFRWIATDNGVLTRTLGATAGVDLTYRPYRWQQDGRLIHAVFRDHFLSDLIGFIYGRMGAAEAAAHFLDRIRENCQPLLAAGRDALVPIILDGENAWEYYERNGRPFLAELYRRISADPRMEALTISEALDRVESQTLQRIFPGSWINANFDVWIGAEEDNTAWEYLGRAREVYEREAATPGAEKDLLLAFEELLIAEGSDWCWWYGPEHESANRVEFDQLFRGHLANVYRALRLSPPEELSRPILRVSVQEFHQPPTGPIHPTVDGEVTSYFEWLGAGVYRVDGRSGAMHGQRFYVRQLSYGSDGRNVYLRVDFQDSTAEALAGMEARLQVQPAGAEDRSSFVSVLLDSTAVKVQDLRFSGSPGSSGVEFGFDNVLEVRFSLEALGAAAGESLRVRLSMWQNGLPVDALPPQGWLEFSTAEPSEWQV
jgi:alpha-amylase/alpha-mannosidase (GH57 family)